MKWIWYRGLWVCVFVWIWVELQPETSKREKRVSQLWKKISTAAKEIEKERNWNKMKKVIFCCHGYLALFNDPLFLRHWLYGMAEIDTVGLYRISNWINWKCDLDCYIQLISAQLKARKLLSWCRFVVFSSSHSLILFLSNDWLKVIIEKLTIKRSQCVLEKKNVLIGIDFCFSLNILFGLQLSKCGYIDIDMRINFNQNVWFANCLA